MAADLSLLMVHLRELARAHERLSRAVPDPPTAIAAADTALERVMTLLDDPSIAGPLGELIPAAHDRVVGAAGDFRAEFKERRSELIKIEAETHTSSGYNPRRYPAFLCGLRARLRTTSRISGRNQGDQAAPRGSA